MRRRRRLMVCLLALCALLLGGLAFDVPPPPQAEVSASFLHRLVAPATPAKVAQARATIQHVVFVLLENHSFDNIFGRFPGADGALTATVKIWGHVSTTPLVPEPYYLRHDV